MVLLKFINARVFQVEFVSNFVGRIIMYIAHCWITNATYESQLEI